MQTKYLEYSNTGIEFRMFGKIEFESITKAMKWLYNFHTAEYYRINENVYKLDHTSKRYRKISK